MMAPETVVTVETNKPSPPQGAPPPQQTGGALDWIKLSFEHFKIIPGMLKLAELVLGILCMALASPAYVGGTHWFLFVAVTSFITTLIWVFVYLVSMREAIRFPINWPLTELFNTALQTLFYFIAFIVQFAAASRIAGHPAYGSYTAAAVFGLFNTVAYAASTYFVFIEHRSTVSVVGTA